MPAHQSARSLASYLSPAQIQAEVLHALREDLGGHLDPDRDLTASLIAPDTPACAHLYNREPMLLCGSAWFEQSFWLLAPETRIEWLFQEGDWIEANQCLARCTGPARALLTAERTGLNFLQSLSGTATQVRHYCQQLAGYPTRLLDTRKTIPGLRLAQKYAVLIGGGQNHRLGLHDAFLIKENHIMACGGIAAAVARARQQAPGYPIEVEVEDLNELQQALAAGADIIMLDNFDLDSTRIAVQQVAGRAKLEASGNVTAEGLQALAATGVDYISSGALTKHLQAIDLSFRVQLQPA